MITQSRHAMLPVLQQLLPNFTTQRFSKKPDESSEYKKLNRGISRATDNVNLVSQVRTEMVLDNIDQDYQLETPAYTFMLPDLTELEPEEFGRFVEKDLMAVSTQVSLEQADRLNWWVNRGCQRLWPLSTSGDGNCLLHAASLAMYGFHDRLLTLRKALHAFLSANPTQGVALWRRWRRQQSRLNALSDLVWTEVEWRQEWNAIVSMASSEPRLRRTISVASNQSGCGDMSNLGGDIYESLEEVHVLALAHVLKRPIIVVADTFLKDMNGEPLAPIPFGGIYLPMECPPGECHRSPLMLAYDGGHFSALVAMDTKQHALASAIPLTDSSNEILPIQFSIDPELREDFGAKMELTHPESVTLLHKYLDVIHIDDQETNSGGGGLLGSIGKSVGQRLKFKLSRANSQRQNGGQGLMCAAIHLEKRLDYLDRMLNNYLNTARIRYHQEQDKKLLEGAASSTVRYGAGNSQFYTDADSESHDRVSQLQPVKAPVNHDTTVYLCKSTFYDTSQLCETPGCGFFGNPQTGGYCSKCFQQQKQQMASEVGLASEVGPTPSSTV
ncbi:OTU domain-containing protein 7B [Nilaparvata lugens]|uniref:OTU domain-containing protein 7B n=1 Tax=Nilaparvata lugens TaxID=108931 RepID=UPI00193E2A4D|nr:OTU domain-containing protein 7B [Nilaparvata lugens]XP_039291868.1 OTU domain-containing protein 7B [Nilaparvata lugens]XP_039291869.1 OTU domain-containing protein 7B [Nilaparvata lugens]